MTGGEFRRLAKKNGDVGNTVHLKIGIGEQEEKRYSDVLGLKKGVDYLVLQSCYPYLNIFQR